MIKLLLFLALQATQGPAIPAPHGLLNDFAGVVNGAHAANIERIATLVRERSGGEIAVVTLKDIGNADVGDVALRIGREWGVGGKAAIGDKKRNAGVVILVVPKETSSDGRGHISISTGQGTEGFLTDARTGDFRREATPDFQQKDYGAGLELITLRVAEQFATEFGFSLDSLGAVRSPQRRRQSGDSFPFGAIVFMVMFVIILLRVISRRGGGGGGSGLGAALPWIVLNSMRGGRGGGGGWGGGGGGGGFGGFGGGGGFSGGGSSGSW